ncbi:MAG: hypothetical protein HC887_10240 [Desulfobacteraceae bacterium]|nr:hypothetical protein [Desulfobacteraceae bacterium]
MSFEQYKGTVEWMALQELYKVDLESFVGFDSDIQFSSPQPSGGGGSGGGYQDQSGGYQDQGGGYFATAATVSG